MWVIRKVHCNARRWHRFFTIDQAKINTLKHRLKTGHVTRGGKNGSKLAALKWLPSDSHVWLRPLLPQVEFEDGSQVLAKREDVYTLDEDLPKKVKGRLVSVRACCVQL